MSTQVEEITGRARDALVAEKIMGFALVEYTPLDAQWDVKHGCVRLGMYLRHEEGEAYIDHHSGVVHASDLFEISGDFKFIVRPDNEYCIYEIPQYSTDISADHSVHQHVCDTWDREQISTYFKALWKILHERWVCSDKSRNYDFDYEQLFPMALYEAGDYSRAALAAASAKGGRGNI